MINDEAAKRQWEEASRQYDQNRLLDEPWKIDLWPFLKTRLPSEKNNRVLDAGCGPGTLTLELAANAREVIGVDWSHQMVEMARSRVTECSISNVTIIQGNTSNLSVHKLGQFDSIWCINVLVDHSDYAGTIKQLARLLRPGGSVLIVIEHPYFTAQYYDSRIAEDHTGTPNKARCPYSEEFVFESDFLGEALPIYGWHRPLSNYIQRFSEAELSLTGFYEPVGRSNRPNGVRFIKIPYFAVFDLQKQGQRRASLEL